MKDSTLTCDAVQWLHRKNRDSFTPCLRRKGHTGKHRHIHREWWGKGLYEEHQARTAATSRTEKATA